MDVSAKELQVDPVQPERFNIPNGEVCCEFCGTEHSLDPDTAALRHFAVQRDPALIAPLFGKFERTIKSEVQRRVKPGTPPDLIEDICQTAAIAIMVNAEIFDCSMSPAGLIRAIAAKSVPEFFRQQGMGKKRKLFFVDMSPRDDENKHQSSIEDLLSVDDAECPLIRTEYRAQARQLLKRLDPHLREVIYLRVAGTIFEDIADILGVATSTVFAWHDEAQQLLKQWTEG
jgi:RNA polymerase sigma factor (sigma-70 family)